MQGIAISLCIPCVCLCICVSAQSQDFKGEYLRDPLTDSYQIYTTNYIYVSSIHDIHFQRSRSKVKVKVIKTSKNTFWTITQERVIVEGRGFLHNNLLIMGPSSVSLTFCSMTSRFFCKMTSNFVKYC